MNFQDNLWDQAECKKGCELIPQQKNDTLGESIAVITSTYVKVIVLAGLPNIFAPFLRTLSASFSYKGQDTASVVSSFFVEGNKDLGSSFSVDFKDQAIPLMVLHDPPGGGSSAFFQETNSYYSSFSIGVGSSLETGVSQSISAGFKQDYELCVGALVAETCQDVLNVRMKDVYACSWSFDSSHICTFLILLVLLFLTGESDGEDQIRRWWNCVWLLVLWLGLVGLSHRELLHLWLRRHHRQRSHCYSYHGDEHPLRQSDDDSLQRDDLLGRQGN